ncbi:MAG: dihydroneopterin aldolase [Chloroflexota bacterium]|nr:dihydroneopterin aldolase [Chloroflexota bacterium]MDE2969634.1 dihydroneopterin aldolase [Chloroflexota bacterium]
MADDRIILTGMVFYGFHGVTDEEQRIGQRFIVDVELDTDTRAAGETDDIAQAVNYVAVYAAARDVVEGDSRRLIEAVAERIAGRVLEEQPVRGVRVRVTKPSPPIPGAVLSGAAVEVYRRR